MAKVLAEASSEALSTAQEYAANIGKMLGQQHATQLIATAQEQAGLPGEAGRISQATVPMIPAPIVSGGAQPPFQVPEEGGGYEDYGRRVAFDKSRLINILNQLSSRAVENKRAKDVATATRDYQVLTSAIAAYQQAQAELARNPNNTQARAIMAHNANIINQFFSDEKKVKKLKDVLNINVAFDQKAKQKKDSKPEGMALDTILGSTSIPKTGQTMNVGGEQMQIAVPAGSSSLPATISPQAATEGVRATQFEPTELSPAATQFMSGIPMALGPRQYIPSDSEFIEINQIAAGLAPDANTRMNLTNTIIRNKGDMDVQQLKSLTDIKVQEMSSYAANLREMLGNANAWDIAWLKHMDDQYANSIRAMEVALRRGENDIKLSGDLFETAKAQYEAANRKVSILSETLSKGKRFDGDDLSTEERSAIEKELRTAYDEANSKGAYLNRAAESRYKVLQKHGTGFPATPKESGKGAVTNFERGATGAGPTSSNRGGVPTSSSSTKKSKKVSNFSDYFFYGSVPAGPIHYPKK